MFFNVSIRLNIRRKSSQRNTHLSDGYIEFAVTIIISRSRRIIKKDVALLNVSDYIVAAVMYRGHRRPAGSILRASKSALTSPSKSRTPEMPELLSLQIAV
jgi:hypothetical protein